MDVLWVAAVDSSAEIAESAALTCLASFKKIDEHYTYILQSDVPASAGKDGNNEDDNNEEDAALIKRG
eukprot:scaffold5460_cov153-Skeletonema_dohrnii-CCMP3373.AAC.14